MKRTPLNPVSKKRRASLGPRRKAVERAFHEQGDRCWGVDRIDGHVCAGALQGHEPLMRSRGGDPDDFRQVVVICWALHDQAHANPEWAETVGLMLSSGTRYRAGRLMRTYEMEED